MAYNFNGTSQILSASAPVTERPFTMSAWVNTTTIAGSNRGIICLTAQSTAHRWLLYTASDATLYIFVTTGGANSQASGTAIGGFTGNTWVHVAATVNSSGNMIAYFNGAAGTTLASSIQPTGISQITIGADRLNSSDASFFSGSIAEACVWDVVLNAAEVSSLAKGFQAPSIRPQSLRFYAPLVRDLQDVRGGASITNTNTATVAAHPRIYA